jgi:hypothetical protein
MGSDLVMPNMTQAELNAFLAKTSTHSRETVGAPVEDEGLLHNQIITECKRRQWIAIHSRMDRAQTSNVGTPDFVIIADKGRTFFIECKSKTGKLSSEQLGMQAWASRLGHRIHVIRSMEEFYEITKL